MNTSSHIPRESFIHIEITEKQEAKDLTRSASGAFSSMLLLHTFAPLTQMYRQWVHLVRYD